MANILGYHLKEFVLASKELCTESQCRVMIIDSVLCSYRESIAPNTEMLISFEMAWFPLPPLKIIIGSCIW